jgi:predicted ATPase
MLLKIIPEVVTILIGEVEVGGKATIMEEVVGAAEEDMEGMEGNLVEEAHSRQSPRLLRQPLRKLQLM